MWSMATTNFSIRIDSELKTWLETEAAKQDRSAGYLAQQAIQNARQQVEAEERMVREALAEADKGAFISEEAMTAWFMSLGTDTELSEPEPDVLLTTA